MQKGQKLPLKQRHRIELELPDLPEGFLDQFSPFPKSRAVGAVLTAVGTYFIVHTVMMFGRNVIGTIQKGFTELTQFTIGTTTGIYLFFANMLGIPDIRLGAEQVGHPLPGTFFWEDEPTSKTGKINKVGKAKPGHEPGLPYPNLFQQDPMAVGAALTAGGMVLAGLNPGEVLKGIGSIIEGLIPG